MLLGCGEGRTDPAIGHPEDTGATSYSSIFHSDNFGDQDIKRALSLSDIWNILGSTLHKIPAIISMINTSWESRSESLWNIRRAESEQWKVPRLQNDLMHETVWNTCMQNIDKLIRKCGHPLKYWCKWLLLLEDEHSDLIIVLRPLFYVARFLLSLCINDFARFLQKLHLFLVFSLLSPVSYLIIELQAFRRQDLYFLPPLIFICSHSA